MEITGKFTKEEIQSQPEAWVSAIQVLKDQSEVLESFYPQGNYSQVIFTGCGSTYYLALAAAALFQELTGQTARALPASELWLYPKSSYPKTGRILLVPVSRSGATTETLRACEAFETSGGGDLLTLSCYGDQPLAKIGTLNLVFPSGAEESIAQTRAFSTLYLATVALATLCSGRLDLFEALDGLPVVGRRLLSEYALLARQLGQDSSLDRFYFLGSGPRYGLACELNLKMKEMSLSHSESFHFMEFRHGPKAMVTANTLVVGLVSEVNHTHEMAVLQDVRSLGARLLVIGEKQGDVVLNSGLDEAICNVLYLLAGQMLAFERSLAKGLNPDRPNNLDAVVKL